MAFEFKTWLFNKLPGYFRVKDSYKDPQGRGLLERYLEIFGAELDEELVEFIHQFLDILDIHTTDDKFLQYMGFLLGSPPDLDGTMVTYRRMLETIIQIYKVKGLEESLVLFFNLMGLKIKLIVYPPTPPITYDSIYFRDTPEAVRDLPEEPCVYFDLFYWSVNDDCSIPTINPLPGNIIPKIREVIDFIKPIDTILQNLDRSITYCDEYNPNLESNVLVELQQPIMYDVGLLFDDGNLYDGYNVVSSNTYTA